MKGDIHSFTMRYISMIYYKRLQRYGGCKLLYLIGLVGSYVLHVMQTNIVTLNIPNMNDGKNERYCALAPWFITLSKRGRFIRTDLDGRMQNAPVATHSSAGTELINYCSGLVLRLMYRPIRSGKLHHHHFTTPSVHNIPGCFISVTSRSID